MNAYARILVGLLVVPGLLAAGCGEEKKKKKKDDDKEEAKKDDKKSGGSGSAVASAAPAPTGGGASSGPPAAGGGGGEAYFTVSNVGLVQISSSGKISVVSGTEDSFLQHPTLGADGAVYVTSFKGISKVEGGGLKLVAATEYGDNSIGSPSHFAVLKDGTIWAASYNKVGKWDGKTWTVEKAETFLPKGKDFISGIGVDSAGKPWITASDSFWVRDGAAWSEVKPDGRVISLHAIRQDTAQNLYTHSFYDVLKVGADKKIEKIDIGGTRLSLSKFALAVNGTMAWSESKKVSVKPAGSPAKTFEGPRDFAVDHIKALGVDESGRAWISTGSSIVVLAANGGKTEWLTGTFPELSDDVSDVLVTKGGPALPAGGAQKKVASLKGKILLDNESIGKTDVELCASPSGFLLSGATPCSEAPVKFAAQTNDSGEFDIKDVPLGSYSVAFKNKEGKWMTTWGKRTSKMKEGQNYDMGSIDVKSPKK